MYSTYQSTPPKLSAAPASLETFRDQSSFTAFFHEPSAHTYKIRS